MSDKKNIDRLFQEKLKNFETTPKDAVWENIHNRLHKDKRKRRFIIPIWWKLAGVAAVLALSFTAGNLMFNISTEENTNNTVVDSNETSNSAEENISEEKLKNDIDFEAIVSEDKDHSKIVNEDSNNKNRLNNKTGEEANSNATISDSKTENNTIVNSNNKTDAVVKNSRSNASPLNKTALTKHKDAVVKNNLNLPQLHRNTIDHKKRKSEIGAGLKGSQNETQNAVAKTAIPEDKTLKAEENTDEKQEDLIENAIAEANTTNEEEKEEDKLNRWSISPNVAPVYFNTLGKGSSIDHQFVNNTKEGEVNMSYGVGGTYALNKKLKIRAGINKLDLGYSTNDVIAFNGVGSRATEGNIKFKDNAMTFLSTESLSYASVPEIVNTNIKGSLDQRFGFVEVPLELEYTVIDKKVGINVIGGFSTMFLTKNEVYSVLEGDRRLIGEATNINDTSYSANFGLGINYNISKKIKVNLEPTFKYQINTFTNSSGDFQPYFIGVYTGLSYKF
jgi:hypothetical protein